MRRPSPSLLLCLATATVLLTLCVVTGDLPERVPTHFDAAGRADGWSTRTGFALELGGLSLFLCGLFGALGALVARLPTSLVNLPNRDYWLAPERRAESLRAIRDRLHSLGAATEVLVLGLVLYCVRASRSEEAQTGPDPTTWVLLLGYLAFVAGWIVSLHRRFAKPPRAG
jgi:hypothetical protein